MRLRRSVDSRSRIGALAAVLVGAAVATTSHDAPGASDRHGEVQSCALDGDSLGVPIVQITTAWFDSLLETAAGFSEAQLTRIDSLYEAGKFGTLGSDGAERSAHLLARLRTINTYRVLALLAADTTCVHEASDSVLADGIARYSDASLICTIRARRVRLGLGHACVRYDLGDAVHSETMLGAKRVAYRVKDEKLQGLRRRVLSLDLPTATGGIVEVLLASHYTFDFRYVRSDGPPAPYEWFLVHEIRGGWLRKWGTHHPTAFMFWTTPLDSAAIDLPAAPLVGVRVYIPNLRFKLPFFLPDFDLDDLREIELPQPILRMAYLRENHCPDWLRVDTTTLAFVGWGGHGEVPAAIRQQFPH